MTLVRAQRPRRSRIDSDVLIFVAGVAAAAAIYALTPPPIFGPAQTAARGVVPAPALTAAGPKRLYVRKEARDAEHLTGEPGTAVRPPATDLTAGRPGLPTALAILAAVAIVVWLFARDLARLLRPEGRRF